MFDKETTISNIAIEIHNDLETKFAIRLNHYAYNTLQKSCRNYFDAMLAPDEFLNTSMDYQTYLATKSIDFIEVVTLVYTVDCKENFDETFLTHVSDLVTECFMTTKEAFFSSVDIGADFFNISDGIFPTIYSCGVDSGEDVKKRIVKLLSEKLIQYSLIYVLYKYMTDERKIVTSPWLTDFLKLSPEERDAYYTVPTL